MNLLPQKEIKILKKETIMRFIIIVCFMISFLEVTSILVIAPSYILIKTERNVNLNKLEQCQQLGYVEQDDIKDCYKVSVDRDYVKLSVVNDETGESNK